MTVYIGIDWSQSKHDVCFLDEAGEPIGQVMLPHSPEGFARFEGHRQRIGVCPADCLVGIETAHNLILDYLWGHGYSQVYVIPPNQVKGSRSRYRQSGARSDPSDAYVIADVLRTDRKRLALWQPDHVLTRQMRSRVSYMMHLTRNISRLSNRLRAVLWRYYPAALEVFRGLESQIALEFVRVYPTPQHATGLRFDEFKAFTQRQRYTHPQELPKCFARLQQPQPEADLDTVLVFQDEAVQLATLLLSFVHAKAEALRDLQHLFQQHPDAPIFASLPGTGEYLAPALLVKFGDDRQRFASPMSVQALAGTCPVTDRSGKRKVIHFRKACDHEFRTIVQQWAKASLSQSVWANAYWQRVQPRCRSTSHAYRCLGNRWLAILWKCWQTRQPYDEAYHLQRRAARNQTRG